MFLLPFFHLDLRFLHTVFITLQRVCDSQIISKFKLANLADILQRLMYYPSVALC